MVSMLLAGRGTIQAQELPTCEFKPLINRCLRSIDQCDGNLCSLCGDQSYSEALIASQSGSSSRLSHVRSWLTICPAPTTPSLLTGVDEELYCLN